MFFVLFIHVNHLSNKCYRVQLFYTRATLIIFTEVSESAIYVKGEWLVRAPLRGQKTFRPLVTTRFLLSPSSKVKSDSKGGHFASTGLFCPLRSPYASTLLIYSRISKAPEWVVGRLVWIGCRGQSFYEVHLSVRERI